MATNLDGFQIIFKILATIGTLGLVLYFIFHKKMTEKYPPIQNYYLLHNNIDNIINMQNFIDIDIDNLNNPWINKITYPTIMNKFNNLPALVVS